MVSLSENHTHRGYGNTKWMTLHDLFQTSLTELAAGGTKANSRRGLTAVKVTYPFVS